MTVNSDYMEVLETLSVEELRRIIVLPQPERAAELESIKQKNEGGGNGTGKRG